MTAASILQDKTISSAVKAGNSVPKLHVTMPPLEICKPPTCCSVQGMGPKVFTICRAWQKFYQFGDI